MIYINLTFAFIAILLSLFNFFRLEIWSQIEYINNIGQLNFLEPSLLVHIPRFIVVYPSFYFGELFDIDENLMFTIYVIILTSLTSMIWLNVQKILVIKREYINYSFVTPFFLLFFVNGRSVFALFGLSLLMVLLIKLRLKLHGPYVFAGIVISLLYASVSSGTFSVALLFLILTSWRLVLNSLLTGNVFVKFVKTLAGLLCFTFLIYFFFLFLKKNLDYYGGGVEGLVNIVSHGMGLILNPAPVLENCNSENGLICSVSSLLLLSDILHAIFIAIFVMLLSFFSAILYSWNLHLFAKQAIIVSVIGGVFGFTTLMSIIFSFPILLKRFKIRRDF